MKQQRGRSGGPSSMARVALWLANEVGEGNVFTKQALRDATPGIEQVDRRMRDLRPHHWEIHNNRHDPRLAPHELRLVKIGDPVWESRSAPRERPISATVRRAVHARDGHLCVSCGISAAEPYADAPHQTASLTVVRRGDSEDDLVTECARCRAGGKAVQAPTASAVRRMMRQLNAADRASVAEWILAGRRLPTPADEAWVALRQLALPDRDAIAAEFRAS